MDYKRQFYTADKREARTTDELIGIAKGLIADQVLNEQEVNFLVQWLEQNNEFQSWPFDVINSRIAAMLEDGTIDAEEREELFLLLKSLSGKKPVAENVASFATTLPLTQPEPKIIIADHSFCFTGEFAQGTRKECEKAVHDAGGKCQTRITKDLDYLVIGCMGNEDWKHSTFGCKIQQAVEYIGKGRSIKIVCEDAWRKAL